MYTACFAAHGVKKGDTCEIKQIASHENFEILEEASTRCLIKACIFLCEMSPLNRALYILPYKGDGERQKQQSHLAVLHNKIRLKMSIYCLKCIWGSRAYDFFINGARGTFLEKDPPKCLSCRDCCLTNDEHHHLPTYVI